MYLVNAVKSNDGYDGLISWVGVELGWIYLSKFDIQCSFWLFHTWWLMDKFNQ
jgi:hypothetical protein